MNTAIMGDIIVTEADDGSTALQAMKTTQEDGYRREIGGVEDDNNIETCAMPSDSVDLEDDNEHNNNLKADFDLVFIDYVMTRLDGPEAVQIMRKDLKFTGGIIGVTGNALPADLTYFKECGADLVITKPLTNQKLMDAVRSVTHNERQ